MAGNSCPVSTKARAKYASPIKYEYRTISLLVAEYFFMAFSWTLPMAASASNESEIMTTPVACRLGDVWLSARVNHTSPRHITVAAKNSLVPYDFFWISIPPTRTGIGLQDLKIV